MSKKLHSWEFLILSACLALAVNLMPGSTYSSPEIMNAYFGGENSLGSWTWESANGSWTKDFEPFKYRLVFRGLVDSLAHVGASFGASRDLHTYWMAYLTVSVAAHAFAIHACYLFLQTVGLKASGRVGGVIAWLLVPPIFFPYSYPVQTKEDFIAYGLCFLALRAMLRQDWTTVVFICVFGAFVRETLLLIAGIFLIGTDAPRRLKIAALLLPIAVHIMLRVILGMEGYQIYRETNFISYLLPVIAFLLAFGYGWAPLAAYLARSNFRAAPQRCLDLFKRPQAPAHTTPQQRFEAL